MVLPFTAVMVLVHDDRLRNTDIGAYSTANTFLFVYFDQPTVTVWLGYLLGKTQCDPLMQQISSKELKDFHRIIPSQPANTAVMTAKTAMPILHLR